jgi:hypothetical protein
MKFSANSWRFRTFFADDSQKSLSFLDHKLTFCVEDELLNVDYTSSDNEALGSTRWINNEKE